MLTESLLAHQRDADGQSVQSPPTTSAQATYRDTASPILVNTTAAAGLIEQHRVLTDNNHNLSNSQKELLSWHCRWGHVGFNQCREILSKPHQPKSKAKDGVERPHMVKPVNKGASTVTNIYCAACMYAKQRQTLPDSETMGRNPEAIDSVTKNAIKARQMVSCDQYQSTTRGRLQHTRGKERDS